MKTLVLGTRGSDLALAQTRLTAEQLRRAHLDLVLETKIIKTIGDQRLDISLSSPGALEKGLFTKELEDALLRGEIDVAIHSLKDMPVDLPDGLAYGAILERADPSDVLVSKTPGGLAGLPQGALVATSSPRRQVQLRYLRTDLQVQDIRGNVPTRLRKLNEDPALAGLVLAKAGLDRLGDIVPAGLHVTILTGMLPAPGQGAIAVQCRDGDHATMNLLDAIHHEPTARCVQAERDLLKMLGGGCSLPFGALATWNEGLITIKSFPPEHAANFKL